MAGPAHPRRTCRGWSSCPAAGRGRCSSCCRWRRCSPGSSGTRFLDPDHLGVVARGAVLSLRTSPRSTGAVRRARHADGAGAGPGALPGLGAALAGPAAAGAAAGGRRHRPALHVRPAGAARRHAGGPRPADRVLDHRGGLAQTFVALPFLVVSLEGALRTAGRRYESVAATLGAAPDDRAAPGHPAPGAARPGVGRGARLRPGARASSARP